MAKKALICGVSGQDGAYLSAFLLNKGYQVFGSTRYIDKPAVNLQRLDIASDVSLISLDLTNYAEVVRTIEDFKPQEIYNLAGQSSVSISFSEPRETFASIALSNLNLLEAMRSATPQARFFSAGSSECFGDTQGEAATELTPFRPLNPYAVAKSAAFWQTANYRKSFGLHASTGILFNHESPLRSERFVTQKIITAVKKISAGEQTKLELGDLTIQRDWGWAPEYVEAMWLMLQQDEPDDYVIATGETHSLEEFVAEAFSQANLTWQDYVVTNKNLYRRTDIKIAAGNPDKSKTALGWKTNNTMKTVVKLMLDAELRVSW